MASGAPLAAARRASERCPAIVSDARTAQQLVTGRKAKRRPAHLAVYAFLLALAAPAGDVIAGTARPAWLAGGALVAFAACFAVFVETHPHPGPVEDPFAGPRGSGWLRGGVAVVMIGLAVATTLAYGSDWVVLFIFVVATFAATAPLCYAPAAVAGVAVTSAVVVVVGRSDTTGLVTAGSWALSIVMAGFISLLLRRRGLLIDELRATQGEVARLAAADAVTEERLRFARDLHDLLGHSLSVIVLKAELARRLLDRDESGAAARVEVDDVEQIARRALEEVREAVTGYRARSFGAELERGRSALDAAGIELRAEVDDAALPADVETLLARVLREAVTNIVRHSGAAGVCVTLARTASGVRLEVRDDGVGGAPPANDGTGLRALAERVADAGGRFTAGPRAAGGFAVTVDVPAGRPAAAEPVVTTPGATELTPTSAAPEPTAAAPAGRPEGDAS